MLRRHLARLGVVAGLALSWALIAAACGGSSTDSNPSGTGGNTATAISSAGSSTPSGDQQIAEAGPELSAFHLLDAAGYAAALGEPVTAVEDDGVVPDQYACEIGQARALTGAGVLITTTLRTADSTDDAKQDYSSVANFGSTPSSLSGVGDQSAYSDSLALVQKGAQVLRVTSEIAPGVDPKANGADPTAALAAAAAMAGKVAPALAAKMTGSACDGPAVSFPDGGFDPCVTSASDFGNAVGASSGATAQLVISDEPPYQECLYSAPGVGPVYVYTATNKLFEGSLSATTAQDEFTTGQTAAINAQERGRGQIETFQAGPFQVFGSVAAPPAGKGLDSTILYQVDASAMRIEPGNAHQVLFQNVEPTYSILMRILMNPSGEPLHTIWCASLMKALLKDALAGNRSNLSDQDVVKAYGDAEKKLIDYCIMVFAKNEEQ